MQFRKVALAAMAGVFVSAAAASAADLPSRAPPPVFVPPAPIFTWTGFYVGGYGGGSFEGTVKDTDNFGDSISAKRDGFTAGGLAGYNYQIGSFVLGVEGDAGYDGERAKKGASFATGGEGGGGGIEAAFVAPGTTDVRFTEKSDGFIGRIRGRVGYAAGSFFFGETLLFIAGGGSFMKEKQSASVTFGGEGGGYSVSVSKQRTGFNIGGGAEVAFTPHILGRVEYLYDDYGSDRYTVDGIGTFKAKLNDNTVRAALEYKV